MLRYDTIDFGIFLKYIELEVFSVLIPNTTFNHYLTPCSIPFTSFKLSVKLKMSDNCKSFVYCIT